MAAACRCNVGDEDERCEMRLMLIDLRILYVGTCDNLNNTRRTMKMTRYTKVDVVLGKES